MTECIVIVGVRKTGGCLCVCLSVCLSVLYLSYSLTVPSGDHVHDQLRGPGLGARALVLQLPSVHRVRRRIRRRQVLPNGGVAKRSPAVVRPLVRHLRGPSSDHVQQKKCVVLSFGKFIACDDLNRDVITCYEKWPQINRSQVSLHLVDNEKTNYF